MDPVRTLEVDRLKVYIYRNRQESGAAAAASAASALRAMISSHGQARVVFASAPSQNEFLHELTAATDVVWTRVTAFHLDEYVGLPSDAPQAFAQFLRERLFDRVNPGRVHYLDGNATDLAAEVHRYSQLLAGQQLDLACLGVGENGHLAFNEPGSTSFQTSELVKVVDLEGRSRQQQVNDGCFSSVDQVPKQAITMTVPAIMAARKVLCIVPGQAKREALERMLNGSVSVDCPASALRLHHDALLFADLDSASRL